MKTQALQTVSGRSGVSSLLLTGVLVISVMLVSCGRHSPRSYEHRGQGWIGVYVQDIDSEMRRYLKLDSRRGVLVNDVVENGPAERAGLRKEDVIVKFDGKSISDTEDLTRAVSRLNPGEKTRMAIIRDDRKQKLKLKIAERPDRYSSRSKTRHPAFSHRSGRAYLGIRTADLDDDLADYFEVDKNQGVLVASVADDGPADKAGIKSGDIILKLENEPIRSTEALLSALSNIRSDQEVEIELLRKGKKKNLTVEFSRKYSFHFDRGELHDWKDNMKSWKRQMKDWHHDFESEFDARDHRIHIDIPLEKLGDELEGELRDLQDELRDLRIEIDFDGVGDVI